MAPFDGLQKAVQSHRNRDGGWSYSPGKSSRLEPTCWALLATARYAGAAVDISALQRWPRHDGWLVDVPGAPINFAFNALAALTLAQDPQGVALARPIAARLVQTKGIALEQTDAIRQDNSLQAWPWIDQTFSWVEPTAWCLLLLKKLRVGAAPTERAAADARITVAERMILDRVCRQGGWNYGSSNVYGQELWAYVPTTALVLIAMQDKRQDSAVVRSVDFMQKDAATERSAVALALAAISLRVYGMPRTAITAELLKRLDLSQAIGNVMGMAMSLYALVETRNGTDAFTFTGRA